jgi:hypothetical protein
MCLSNPTVCIDHYLLDLDYVDPEIFKDSDCGLFQ